MKNRTVRAFELNAIRHRFPVSPEGAAASFGRDIDHKTPEVQARNVARRQAERRRGF